MPVKKQKKSLERLGSGWRMSKGLEALKILKATAIATSSLVKESIEHIEEYIEEQATTIEKDLEVLEQIKELTKSNPDLEEEILLSSRLEEYQKIKEWLENEN